MVDYIDHFNEISRVAAEQRSRDDALDKGLEAAGLDGSRRARFGVSDAENSVGGKEKSEKERIARTLRWLLLNDAEYARLHGEAMTAIRLASQQAQDLITLIETELAAIHGIIADIMDSAAQLPDGTRVFRDEGGVVRYVDGEIVPDDLAETIEWGGDEPGYEYQRQVYDRESQLTDALHVARGMQVELGGYRNELTNNENAAEKARVSDVKDRTGEIGNIFDDIEASLVEATVHHSTASMEKSSFNTQSWVGTVTDKSITDFVGKP